MRPFLKAADWIRKLNRVLEKCLMSPILKQAVEEIVRCLDDGSAKDLDLAYQLACSESYIHPKNDRDKAHAFQENPRFNKEQVGVSIKDLLKELMSALRCYRIYEASGYDLEYIAEVLKKESEDESLHPVIRRMALESYNQEVETNGE